MVNNHGTQWKYTNSFNIVAPVAVLTGHAHHRPGYVRPLGLAFHHPTSQLFGVPSNCKPEHTSLTSIGTNYIRLHRARPLARSNLTFTRRPDLCRTWLMSVARLWPMLSLPHIDRPPPPVLLSPSPPSAIQSSSAAVRLRHLWSDELNSTANALLRWLQYSTRI